MRCLGKIDGQKSAEKFVAHLLTLDISTQIEPIDGGGDQWEIWVRDEDRMSQAQRELSSFEANVADPKYNAALTMATQILQDKERTRREAAKQIKRVEMSSGARMGARGKMPPLTLTLLIICVLLGIVTNFGTPGRGNSLGQTVMDRLSFVSNSDFEASEGSPAASIMRGELWRMITPSFLHGNIVHLAMNMFMLVSFGRIVERWVGTPQFAVLVVALAIGPNLLQGLSPAWMQGSPFFVGISGVLYGLFGFVMIRGAINPSHGISIPFPMVVVAVGLIVVGLSGIVPNWPFADLCHLGGLVIGSAFGFAAESAKLTK